MRFLPFAIVCFFAACGDDGPTLDLGVDGASECTEGDPCDLDGDGCTREVCRSGVCTADEPVDCDDGDACTLDRCVSTSSATFECQNDASQRSCVIGGACFADGAPNPMNGCELCDVGESMSDWSFSVAACDDGDACTTGDTCSEGVCVGTVVGDDNEPNDVPGDAIRQPEIADSTDFPQSNERGLIFPAEDEDFFIFSVRDTFGGAVAPRVELSDIPEGTNYQLCGFANCLEGDNSDVACSEGNSARFEGMQGCCSDNEGNADEAIILDANCSGFDDSVEVLVRIRSTGEDVTCSGEYTVEFGDD